MCAESKILTGLMERRALEAAIRELVKITDRAQVAERVESIAQYGSAALGALISALDTNDAQLRGNLGVALTRLDLPREQVVGALHAAARTQDRSPQARVSALVILERFFGEPPDEALLARLQGSDEAAQRSLGELVDAMGQDPLAILEYLAQLGEQPPEVPPMLLQAIPAMPFSPHLITLLRMFAQDPDVRLAEGALEQLGRLRFPAAARALAALAETLPPALASAASRGVRKLRLSGITPDGDDGGGDMPWYAPDRRWRVLMSPVDGSGAQVIWFVGSAPADERAMLVSVMYEEARGLTNASGALDLATADLPPVLPLGSLHHVTVGQHSVPLLLEAPFAAGRRVLREALVLNWETGTPTPLAYRLLNLPLWLADSTGDLVSDPLEAISAASGGDPRATAGLLDHPAFWSWPGPVAEDSAQAMTGHAPADRATAVRRLVQSRFTPSTVRSYQRRLRRMAEWLSLGGDGPAAALAQAAAEQLGAAPPQESPFLVRLVDLGLQAGGLVRHQRKPTAKQNQYLEREPTSKETE